MRDCETGGARRRVGQRIRAARLVMPLVVAFGLLWAPAAFAVDIGSPTGPPGSLLHIYIGTTMGCQVVSNDGAGGEEPEFYFHPSETPPDGHCNTFLGGLSLLAVSQSDITGDGTTTPRTVVTVATTSDGLFEVTRTDSYLTGSSYHSKVDVKNLGDTPASTLLWHGADCTAQGDDRGYGFFDSASGGIYCSPTDTVAAAGRMIGFVPSATSPGSSYFEGDFPTARSDPGPGGFPNTCTGDLIDNGIGLSWPIDNLAVGATITFDFDTTVTPAGTLCAPAPDTTITSGPSDTVDSTSASFEFESTDPEASFECRLDNDAFEPCTSPQNYSELNDGTHTFEVRATSGGAPDPTPESPDPTPASRTWTVDTAATPETTITSGPSGTVDSTTASFEFESTDSEASFECSLDGGGFEPCTSPQNYSELSEGTHTFDVRATSGGGPDPTPETRTWTVNTTGGGGGGAPPAPAISAGPPSSTAQESATFTFGSSQLGVSFQCSLDGGAFEPCTSPKSYTGLSNGPHTFAVRSVNGSGTASAPSSQTWTVTEKTLGDLPAPVLGKEANVEPVSGEVFVAIRGNAAASGAARAAQKGLKFVPLQEARQVPVGSFLDTRKGIVAVQSSSGSKKKKAYLGNFASGLFQVLQSRKKSAKGLTDLVMKGGKFSSCKAKKKGKRATAALSKKALRQLRGSAKGRFRTKGRYGAATVRRTKWTVTDRCDGTLVKVTRGKVAVRDYRRKKTVLVKTGKSYLAKAPR